MDLTRDVPLGFGMALAQNLPALTRFGAMEHERQMQFVDRARNVKSRAEMQPLVGSI